MAAKMAIKWQKLKVKKFEGKIYCGSDYMKQIRGGGGAEGKATPTHHFKDTIFEAQFIKS